MKLELLGYPKTSPQHIKGFILYGGNCNDCRDARDEQYLKDIKKLENEGYGYLDSIDLSFFGDPYGKENRDPLYPYYLVGRIMDVCPTNELAEIMEKFKAYYLDTIDTSNKALGVLAELEDRTK